MAPHAEHARDPGASPEASVADRPSPLGALPHAPASPGQLADGLNMIYGDLVGRLGADDRRSAQTIGLNASLIALMGVLLIRAPLPTPALALAAAAVTVSCLSTLTSFVALLPWVSIRNWVEAFGLPRWLISERAYRLGCLHLEPTAPVIHTRAIMSRFGLAETGGLLGRLASRRSRKAGGEPPHATRAPHIHDPSEALKRYMDDVASSFPEHLAAYVVFLAALLEVKRRPRMISMLLTLLGVVLAVSALVVGVFG